MSNGFWVRDLRMRDLGVRGVFDRIDRIKLLLEKQLKKFWIFGFSPSTTPVFD